jgi:hypothetical protein
MKLIQYKINKYIATYKYIKSKIIIRYVQKIHKKLINYIIKKVIFKAKLIFV